MEWIKWSRKLDVSNGIFLSPNLDSLFDKHLISFRDNSDIMISKNLITKDLQTLGIYRDMKLRKVYDDMKSYLKKHRTKFFEQN